MFFLVLILSLSTAVCAVILIVMQANDKKNTEILSDYGNARIKESIKIYVDTNIELIEAERRRIEKAMSLKMDAIEPMVTLLVGSSSLDDEQVFTICQNLARSFDGYTVFALNKTTNKLINTDDTSLNQAINNLSQNKKFETSTYTFIYGYSNDAIYKKVKNVIHDYTFNAIYPQDSYLVVKEVLDFNGGDKYAVMIINSSAPDREGEFLSTEGVDSAGYKFRLNELNAIKKNKELFFDYNYVDSKTNKEISALQYSKLYPDYNWIITYSAHDQALETQLFDLNQQSSAFFHRYLLMLIFSAIGITVIIIFAFVLVERSQYKQSSKTFKKLEDKAYLDPLTTCVNRHKMEEYLESSFKDYTTSKTTFCIIMLDIDHFKNINDTYGHASGDIVLKELSRIIKSQSRSKYDMVCRWGGEEFLIVTNDHTVDDATLFAERIRSSIETANFELKSGCIPVTISLGVSIFKDEDNNAHDTIERTDKALYFSKENGRNRVSVL